MSEINVLSGGIEVLNEIKENLLELSGYKEKSIELFDRQKDLDRQIKEIERSDEEEINSTLKLRREEVESSFDGQMEATRARMKMVKAKRNELKSEKVSARIKDETADVSEEIRRLNQDIKALFDKNRIPKLFNNKFFFSYFFPSEMMDYITILISAVVILALPWIIYIFLPVDFKNAFIMILIYILIIAIVYGIYTLIYYTVKKKHLSVFKEIKALRSKVRRAGKKEKKIQKRIQKDKDESNYGLEKYDTELVELDSQIDEIIHHKKEALTELESTTKKEIVDQIRKKNSVRLENLKNEMDAAYNEQKNIDEKINSFTIEISRKYETYMGKEALSIPMIDSLIEIIQTGDALNIADALTYYKKSQNIDA